MKTDDLEIEHERRTRDAVLRKKMLTVVPYGDVQEYLFM